MSDKYVQVPVPERFVSAILRRIVELENEEAHEVEQIDSGQPILFSEPAEGLFTRMYVESRGRQRDLLRLLASQPDQWFSTADVARELGIIAGTQGAGGMIGAFGRRAKNRYGGRLPWRQVRHPESGENFYMMDSDIARIITQIAEELEEIEF
ncbi:MAG: hypothetical protein HYX29_01280 [Solirubrobacterales bacterium]|nr:hypothetical protein [Solirubrobacterales bacterium]